MEYNLELADGKKVPLYFGTWALARFCEINGDLSVTEMESLLGGDISYKHILSLVLCCAENYTRKHKKPFDYTDVDAGDWIDGLGGLANKKALDLIGAIGKAVNPSYQSAEVVKESQPGKKK
jgi:hypothetical protein